MKKNKLNPELTWDVMTGAVQAMLTNPIIAQEENEYIVGRAIAINILLHAAMDTMFGDHDDMEEHPNGNTIAH